MNFQVLSALHWSTRKKDCLWSNSLQDVILELPAGTISSVAEVYETAEQIEIESPPKKP